jgi:glycosyltransferase involved in cell wall biosynthesis
MNIIYFHQHFSTPSGSVGVRSYEMARMLIKKGHEVTMVCGSYNGGNTGLIQDFSKGKRSGLVDGINVIEYDLSYSNSDGFIKRSMLFAIFAMKGVGLALTQKYDVIFATTTPLTSGIPGIFARWLRGKKFVFEVRDLWPELPKAMGVITNPFILKSMSILEWLSYRSAHRCIGLSPGIVKGIRKRGVPKDRIKLVSNGCDLDIFNSESQEWRPSEVKTDDFMVVFTGTHGIANGLGALLDVAVELRRRKLNNVKIVLIGQGGLKSSLQSKAMDMNLDNVIFHDPVDKEKLSGLMKSADLGLQILANIPAFYYGTSPNKFFDYIAAGLPVLNNYPGWLAEMIEDNKCGYSVKPENPKLFVDALEDAFNNKDKIKSMGINARALAERDFDRVHLASEWAEWVLGVKQ